MAKKKEPTMMEALTEYMGLKNIDEDTMVKVMEESLRCLLYTSPTHAYLY